MEEPLFRTIARIARQRVVQKLRAGTEVEPRLIASSLLDELSQHLKIDTCRASLLARVEEHIADFVERSGKSEGTSEPAPLHLLETERRPPAQRQSD